MTKTFGPIGIEFMEKRGISAETAARYGTYTAKRTGDGDVIPDSAGNIVVFPFIDHGCEVGAKYRAPGKKFWQRQGGKRTFWNADVLDDESLAHMPLIITEGEPDALAAIECGFLRTVSVPDGAPPVREDEDPNDLPPVDAGAEQSGKFEYLWNNRERLRRVKRFVLAVDNDKPGQRLAAELVRRLSASRCSFVTYPLGCKDINDVLMRAGPEAVSALLNAAQPYPVRGLYRLSDYPVSGQIETYETGWWSLDQNLRLFAGEFMVVTGIPGHGKSTFILNLLSNLADLHGWRAAVFSPEMPTVPHLRDKLRRIKGYGRKTGPEIDAWIEDRFVFIDADPSGKEEDDFDLEWIIERATDAVLRDGVRVLLIDPWNEVEHARRRDESVTDYIGRSIRALKRFAKQYGVAVIVIAHPTKDVGKEGKSRIPTLYDIEGSAHWYNKCDHGLIIDRPRGDDETELHIAKCRFEESGEKGCVKLRFNKPSSRYLILDESEAAQ